MWRPCASFLALVAAAGERARSARSSGARMASFVASHSRVSGATITGPTISMILSRSVSWAPSWLRLSGSRPRSNSVPRIDGSIPAQSSRAAASACSMSSRSTGTASPSSNSPPLNHATSSKPTKGRFPEPW